MNVSKLYKIRIEFTVKQLNMIPTNYCDNANVQGLSELGT